MEEIRIKHVLIQAGIAFEENVYIGCRGLGESCRVVDFVIHINHGVVYLEIGKHEVLIAYTFAYMYCLQCQLCHCR